MGKTYRGTIEGKFLDWDTDLDELGVEYVDEQFWKCEFCGYRKDEVEDGEISEECDDYDAEQDEREEPEENTHWFKELSGDGVYTYTFTEKDLPILSERLEKTAIEYLETDVNTDKDKKKLLCLAKLIAFSAIMNKKDNEETFWKHYYKMVKDKEQLIGRIYIGWKVYWCLVKEGECNITTYDCD